MTSLTRRAVFLFFVCPLMSPHPTRAQDLVQEETPPRKSPAELLKSAKIFFIRSKSAFFKPATLEQELLRREECEQWEIVIARNQMDAELIIEVDRKRFTNIFVYSLIDPVTDTVIAGGKIGSLGGSVEGQIADSLVRRLHKARPTASITQRK
jgi:hypothetical protein